MQIFALSPDSLSRTRRRRESVGMDGGAGSGSGSGAGFEACRSSLLVGARRPVHGLIQGKCPPRAGES